MSDGGWKAGELADTLREGDFDADIDAVLSDDEVVGDCLMRLSDGPLRQLLAEQTSTDMLREARQQSDIASMSAATGLSEKSVEATGYDMLIDRIKPAAQQVLIKGPKGSGKTVLGLDILRQMYAEFDGELSIFTNISSPEDSEIDGPDEHPAVTYGETMSEMLEWVRDTEEEKIVLGDEWSTTMNAHAYPGGDIRQAVSRFINALRKGSGGSTRLVIIGHESDTDIASILRTQSDVVIEKAGKADEGLADRATVYDGWEAYQSGDDDFIVRGLQDVPESSVWGTDSNYFAFFEPDLDNPRQQIRRGKLVEDWEQYQDAADGDESDGEGSKTVCKGTKSDGDPCHQLTGHDSGYCRHHRDQKDEDDER